MARILLGISLGLSLLLATGPAPAAASSGGRYVPLAPVRILDTRTGLGSPTGLVQAGTTLVLGVAGQGGVPGSGATAVVMNVTVTGPAAAGYLTVWPGGPLPLASNLNFSAGQTVPNLIQVGLSAGGQVSIYASTSLYVIADVEGWFNGVAAGPDGRFNPIVPTRLLDTRTGFGGSTTIGPRGSVSVPILGKPGLPASGVSAVVLNVTATNPTAAGYITAWPHGLPRPLASNLNFIPGQTVANRAVVMVGPGGMVDFGNGNGSVDLVVDISGWFTDASGSSGAVYFDVAPNRILDTRRTANPLQPGGVLAVQIAGRGGLPAMGGAGSPTAVVANVTVTSTSAASYLTAWPDGSALPLASDLNWTATVTVANLVIVALGPSGAIDLFNDYGSTDVIVDVVGYYVGPPLPPAPAPTHFGTLGPGSVLPSGAQCALWVRSQPIAENKGVNRTANQVTGQSVAGSDLFAGDAAAASQVILPRIDGQFTGTTHEVLRWAACKWGIDEDWVAAQAAIESWWRQTALGDFGSDPTRCPPGHGLGVDGTAGRCPESYGVLQNRYPYEQPTWPGIGNSTAMNADTAYAIWRNCFEGYETWLGGQYGAGDAWGCIGRWFSGRWHDSASDGYVQRVQGYLSSRIWETANFQEP